MVKDREAWWACCSPWGWQRVGHDRANEHNISQFLEYTHDHCTFLKSGLSGMWIISHLKKNKALYWAMCLWYRDKIAHGPHFKEAHSLLGECKLTIKAQNIHPKEETYIGCCRKRYNQAWMSWKLPVTPILTWTGVSAGRTRLPCRSREHNKNYYFDVSAFLTEKTIEVQCRLPEKIAYLPLLEPAEMILWHLPSEFLNSLKPQLLTWANNTSQSLHEDHMKYWVCVQCVSTLSCT